MSNKNKLLFTEDTNPLFIYDGKCPFCNYFAELTELKSGIPGLTIKDGRDNIDLLNELNKQGYKFSNGAILIVGDNIMHGDTAITWICAQMNTSDNMLKFLSRILASERRTKIVYPFLLVARRLALTLKGHSIDP